MIKLTPLLLGVLLVGCDRSGLDKVPQPNEAFPAVVEVGQLEVISASQYSTLEEQGAGAYSWCDSSGSVERDTVGDRDQAEGLPLCYYGQVGTSEIGGGGGATFTFEGTGGQVCLVVDPETVFWNQSVAADNARANYSYPDVEADDGDMDMFAGLSAYYTGSPGVEIGDFTGFYTDSQGNEIEIEYGLCNQTGAQSQSDAHAGRGTAEYCTINTANYVGVEFTVVLETFSVPLDDGILSFGAMVLDGPCAGIDECTLPAESLEIEGGVRECTPNLEAAYCGQNTLEAFCCLHPDMCGEDATIDECESAFEEYDVNNLDDLRATFCSSTNLCCDAG